MANPSYYFTLFKKFESLGHVMEGSFHGAAPGPQGVNYTSASNLLTMIRTGGTLPLIGATTAASPLWRVLDAKANGTGSFTFDGQTWLPMPLGTGADAAWADFGGLPLINAFAAWIAAGRPNDIPAFITPHGAGTVPGAADAGGAKPFVCSSATDDGTRPGSPPIPSNFWASSLIYLVNPASGLQATPATLQNGAEYYLAAVVGNRGDAAGGKYAGPTGPAAAVSPQVQASGWAMAWGTGGSTPAVQLPSLSNNDITSTSGVFDLYFLKSMRYAIVGFRFLVKDVFDGLILAINDAVADGVFTLPTGVSATDYITTNPSHVCVKVGIRRDDAGWPANDASPLLEPRIAQRNLMVFDVDNLPPSPMPNIIWKYFTVGGPLSKLLRSFWTRDAAIGQNTLLLRAEAMKKFGRVHLAVPRATFKKWIGGPQGLKGFEILDRDCNKGLGVPFVDHVVLTPKDEKAAFRLPFMDEHALAMAIGVEVDPKRFQPGDVRRIELEHRAVLPVFGSGKEKRCYRPAEQAVGGFTIEVRRAAKGYAAFKRR
jgi:hypothetical protein